MDILDTTYYQIEVKYEDYITYLDVIIPNKKEIEVDKIIGNLKLANVWMGTLLEKPFYSGHTSYIIGVLFCKYFTKVCMLSSENKSNLKDKISDYVDDVWEGSMGESKAAKSVYSYCLTNAYDECLKEYLSTI